ncbi:hypothetical protein HIMB100_00019060 [SAR116 cluster alpha proteobacterium HIMB100]|nr:hypothetical protein HIMB100_00019060 [SAR116 cluster alpha proteobacterium HIMB100]
MSNLHRGIGIIFACFVLAGCQTMELTTKSITPATVDYSYAEGKLVGEIGFVELTKPVKVGGVDVVPWTWWKNLGQTQNGRMVQKNFQTMEQVLVQSLRSANLYKEGADKTIRMLEVFETLPAVGLDMKCTVKTRYVIQDIFDEVIETEFVSKMSDHFIGAERLKKACRGAWRKNLEILIDRLVHFY